LGIGLSAGFGVAVGVGQSIALAYGLSSSVSAANANRQIEIDTHGAYPAATLVNSAEPGAALNAVAAPSGMIVPTPFPPPASLAA
jgi:hypothetical protein